VQVPFVGHLSNLFARERRRQKSLFADLAVGLVTGFGGDGYVLALRGLHGHLSAGRSKG
jgi:3-dehydroquinate dehydratase-2